MNQSIKIPPPPTYGYPPLDLDQNSVAWLDRLHKVGRPYTTNGHGDCHIPFESPLWYRNCVPEGIESFVTREVFSDIRAAIADSRKKAKRFSKIMRAVICGTTCFFPILFMGDLLERHELKRCLTKKMRSLNRYIYDGKSVLSFDGDSVIFKPSLLQRTIVPTQVFDYRLGNESMANASPFNNNFNVVKEGPKAAANAAVVNGNASPKNKNKDETFLLSDGRQVVYPVLVENTGGVNVENNHYKRLLPRNLSPSRSRLSSLSVPETTETNPHPTLGKSLSSKDVIPSPRPPGRSLSPEKISSQRSFKTSLKLTPPRNGEPTPPKNGTPISSSIESKAVPSINAFDIDPTIETTKSEMKSAMMRNYVPVSATVTPPRPPTDTMIKALFPTPTPRSV